MRPATFSPASHACDQMRAESDYERMISFDDFLLQLRTFLVDKLMKSALDIPSSSLMSDFLDVLPLSYPFGCPRIQCTCNFEGNVRYFDDVIHICSETRYKFSLRGTCFEICLVSNLDRPGDA